MASRSAEFEVKRYRFGAYEFDRTKGELFKGGVKVAIEAQPARALGLLVSKLGEVVTKDELKREIWGDDNHVDFDRGLAYCISEIRSTLQDSGTNPRFVQTLPRQGYRFIAPVTALDPPRRKLARAAIGVLTLGGVAWLGSRWFEPKRPIVVGVSIFDNETGKAELDRWVAGLSDSLVARLTTLAPDRIQVIGNAEILRRPRNIRQLKNIARELKADYVMLGQLQNDGDGFRFVTHLIRLSDGVHLKANRIYSKDQNFAQLEEPVLGEFETAARNHLLLQPKA